MSKLVTISGAPAPDSMFPMHEWGPAPTGWQYSIS